MSERSHACACITPITVWVVLNNASNYLLEIYGGIYISLEMYQITVICSVKHFTTCYIEGELHMKSILCDAQLLTIMDKRAHAVSKMPNTLKL